MTPVLNAVATLALAGAGLTLISNQCRKPSRWLGRFFLRNMNSRHAGVTEWGLQNAPIEPGFTILDVGCGGGRTVATLAAKASSGKVYGIDYSSESVAVATSTNAASIAAGRVDIRQGSVSHLPYPDETFDLVTAVETHYYWPDPVSDLREIRRVVKRGGHLAIIAETYRGQRFDTPIRLAMKLLRASYLTPAEHQDLFTAAGYLEVEVRAEPRKGWISVIGRAPG